MLLPLIAETGLLVLALVEIFWDCSKSDKTERPGPEAEKEPQKAGPRKGRPSKADKAAPGKAQPSQRDKLSRSGGKAPEAPAPPDA